MGKPIYIFSMSTHYTRCVVYHGSRMLHNLLGTSTLVPDKGLSRHQRYYIIAKWLREDFDLLPPSYQTTTQRKKSRAAIRKAASK
jgi:hypothetical protein